MSDAPGTRARLANPLPWVIGAIGGLALFAYWLASRVGSIGPGDPGSRAFGIAAAVALLASWGYSARRRSMRWAPGRVAPWLDAHLYLGVLTCLLVLLHTGLRMPSGFLTWAMWGCTLWLTAGGLAGRFIQLWIPRALTSGLTTEVLYERIPALVEANAARAQAIAASSPEDIRRFYLRRLEHSLAEPRRRPMFLADITGGSRVRIDEFRYLEGRFDGAGREALAELEALYRSKLELDAHYTLQWVLRTWPLTHVPVAVLLLVLVLFHVLSILYY